jgi:hypothetical protein
VADSLLADPAMETGRRFIVKKILFIVLIMIPLSVFALDKSNMYQTARRILADNVPVKAIAAIF